MSSIAERIEAVMKERKVSRYKLAKDTGIPYTTVTQILNGRTKNPQITALQKIADYFDMQLDQLTKETEEAPKHNAPEWASTKDLADIKKILEEDQPVLFDGVPITDDTRQRAMDILTGLLWEAKELNKKTYGRKKKATPKDKE